MTDTLLDYDPNDTGEIRRPVGETRTRIDTGEKTVRIPAELIKAPSFDAIPRRVIDLDDTVIYNPETIGLAGPQDPPPPLPPMPPAPPKYDMAAAQPVGPWERLVDTERLTLLGSVAGVDGELHPARARRRSVPYVMPADRKPWSEPRHAKRAPLWARVCVVVGLAMVAGGTIALGVLAVIR